MEKLTLKLWVLMLTPGGWHQNCTVIHPDAVTPVGFLPDYEGIMLYRKKKKELPKQKEQEDQKP